MDLAAFMADRNPHDAVIRNLEVIGEACNNVAKNHPAYASEHTNVPWGFALRNASVAAKLAWSPSRRSPMISRMALPPTVWFTLLHGRCNRQFNSQASISAILLGSATCASSP